MKRVGAWLPSVTLSDIQMRDVSRTLVKFNGGLVSESNMDTQPTQTHDRYQSKRIPLLTPE
jgi:hypothetical protein